MGDMKTKVIYSVMITLIIISWVGNYAYKRYSQLPEAGFLRHYIETTYIPSAAFDLLYVANKDDKRKIVNVRVEELPALTFSPVQIHQELRHQTIYLLRGSYEGTIERKSEMDPLKLHTVKVIYSNGVEAEEDVGEIIVYRDAWPLPEEERAIQMSSAGGGTDHKGWASIRTTRPVTLTDVSSSLLDKMGTTFEYEVKPSSDWSADSARTVTLPVELKSGVSVALNYQFLIPNGSKQAMDIYNVLLRENFKEPGGQEYTYPVFANYRPYLTESQMRAYVREQRRQAR
jgi:hypothetical protein